MNNSLFFVVCIVAIVFAGNAFQTYIKSRGAKSDEDSSELEETLAKIEVLEERIRVLERIVTENRYDLKSEINSL
jgi:hypothetical protein